jgi:putative endonuclease
MYFVYILKSVAHNRYYVGYSNDPRERLRKHNNGSNISTKSYRPWVIVYAESFQDKKTAWLREQQIKRYKGGEAFKRLLGK